MKMRLLLVCGLLLLLPLLLAATPVVETTGNLSFSGSESDGTLSVTFNSAGGGGVDGGAGGGGGAATADACQEKGASTASYFDQMRPGKMYTLKPITAQFLIRKVAFSVLENVTNEATFSLSHVLSIGCEAIPAVSGDLKAIGYERIDYIGVKASNIAPGVTISFSVPRTIFERENATPQELAFHRYQESNWVRLDATLLEENADGYATYTVTSPGLSYFAFTLPAPIAPPSPQENGLTGNTVSQPGAASPSPDGGEGESVTGEGTITENAETPMVKRFPFWSFLVVIIIGAGLGIYYYRDYQKRIDEVNQQADAAHPKEAMPIIGRAEIDEQALLDPVERLRAYVDKEMRQGQQRDAIAAELRKSGWPENIIVNVLDDFSQRYLEQREMHEPHDDYGRTLAFLKEKLALGYDVAVIKRSLVKAGWDATLITHLFSELNAEGAARTAVYSDEALLALRAFIDEEVRKGYAKEQVKRALLKAGWQERVIDEELAKH